MSGDDFTKEVAKSQLDALGQYRSIVYEQHSHSFRWLTASLLAINGGAALGILNSSFLPATAVVLSGSFFALGIVFALLIAVTAQRAVMKGIPPIQEQIGYWINVAIEGQRDTEREAQLLNGLSPSLRISFLGQIFGWMSAFFFLVGLASIAYQVVDRTPAQTKIQASDKSQTAASAK